MKNTNKIAVVVIIFLAALTRLIPHPPNFTPIVAVGFLSGIFLKDYKYFYELIDLNAYEFPVQDFEVLRNQILLSGNGAFSNVTISKEKMLDFLKKTQEMLSESVKVHAKIISSN